MSIAPDVAPKGLPLHTKVLIGLGLGAVAGVAANAFWADSPGLTTAIDYVAQPVGQVFLRMLFMVVVPLVFASLVLGVAGLGDMGRLGRIGFKTFVMFIVTTVMAVMLGLFLVNTVKPGLSLDPTIRAQLMEQFSGAAAERVTASENSGFGINTFVNIVPRNPLGSAVSGDMLGLIFFSIVFGIALARLPAATAGPVMKVLDGIMKAVEVIIGFAMKLAPYGVAGLIFSVTARFGFGIVRSLGVYVALVLGGLVIHQFVVLGAIARFGAGISPVIFFRRARAMMVTAFSTSSSNATIPTTLRTATQEFGVPREIAGFVIPLGATMNMNGTALFEGITVLFLAQVFGVDLSLAEQGIVIVLVVLTAIGASGVPSGSIPLLILVLETMGIPGEGIALVLGVDRILDMTRTVPNVTGDLLTAVVVARTEGVLGVPDVTTEWLAEPVLEGVGAVPAVLAGETVGAGTS